jgi:signal transduction histidine kinase
MCEILDYRKQKILKESEMSTDDTDWRNSQSGETGATGEPANVHSGEELPFFDAALAPKTTSQPLERLLVELLATIGHELRTPLTIINGYTSMLLRQDQQLSPAEQHEFLQMIQQAGGRLEFLTDRLLEIAQLEAGVFQLDYSLVDISALAREAISAAERHVPEPLRDRFIFHLQCRDETGNQTETVPPVKGDGRCLRKVLEHLLENAIRYSPDGGRIDVIARPVLAPQEGTASEHDRSGKTPLFLEICVCDFGLGIPEEHLERIFAHFYRVDTRLTREVYGLGLGLTVCNHLVALHQGRIWAESCPDGGSAFHVWLPLGEPQVVHERA